MWRGFLTSLALLLVALVLQTRAWEPHCELDDEGTNEALSGCVRKGRHFLNKYLKYTQGRGRRMRRNFDTCRTFNSTFQGCMQPLIQRCPSIHQQIHPHWKTLYDVMTCACEGSPECVESVTCFETHYFGTLGHGCDRHYKFNVRQRTRSTCYFLRDRLNCKMALVSSACSTQATSLAHHVHVLQHKDKHDRHNCQMHWDSKNNKFKFTEKCTAEKLLSVGECDKQLDENYLYFDKLNDLVADGGKKAVKKACRDFKNYMICMKPIRDSCPRGTQLLDEFDSDLRRYILKMDYICNEKKEEYLQYLQCYQDVMANGTLASCDHIWGVARPLLDSVSSYEFYCQEDNENSSKLRGSLDDLRVCYEKVFEVGCGGQGMDVMAELIRRAFRDPFYLKFAFIPNCTEHSTPQHEFGMSQSDRSVYPTVVGKRDKPHSDIKPQDTGPKQEASRTKNNSNCIQASSFLVLSLVLLAVLLR